ncbi:MAG: hypothetical protein WAZ98_00775 [Cyclobacteriaceae bacterium]
MKKTIKYLLTGCVALGMGAFTLVSCGGDDELPKIDGYNNSDEVAADNLLANWTFDGTYEEDESGAEPLAGGDGTFGTVGFESGQIGQALKLTAGALRYPNIAALNTADALQNYTVSMWVKIKNNKGTASEGYSMLFGLFPDADTEENKGDFMWGNINMAAETGWFAGANPQPDTLVLKGHFVIKNTDGSINGQDNRPDPRGNPPFGVFKHTGEWVHFVARWNSTTRQFHIFGNGVSIGKYFQRGDAPPALPLRMNVPCSPVFGNGATTALGFPNGVDQQTWSPMATASIDDVRVYNTALSDAEVTALFNLGSAGR